MSTSCQQGSEEPGEEGLDWEWHDWVGAQHQHPFTWRSSWMMAYMLHVSQLHQCWCKGSVLHYFMRTPPSLCHALLGEPSIVHKSILREREREIENKKNEKNNNNEKMRGRRRRRIRRRNKKNKKKNEEEWRRRKKKEKMKKNKKNNNKNSNKHNKKTAHKIMNWGAIVGYWSAVLWPNGSHCTSSQNLCWRLSVLWVHGDTCIKALPSWNIYFDACEYRETLARAIKALAYGQTLSSSTDHLLLCDLCMQRDTCNNVNGVCSIV